MTKKQVENAQVAELNRLGQGRLPGMFGIEITSAALDRLESQLEIVPQLLASNGFLHAATVIALADTTCGYATRLNLPDGAENFTTIELKSNHISTAVAGFVRCTATPVHRGKSTQVWDATVITGEWSANRNDDQTDRTIAVFRCTQMILWPR